MCLSPKAMASFIYWYRFQIRSNPGFAVFYTCQLIWHSLHEIDGTLGFLSTYLIPVLQITVHIPNDFLDALLGTQGKGLYHIGRKISP